MPRTGAETSMERVEDYLLDRIGREGTIHMTLIDPDKITAEQAASEASEAEAAGTSAIMVGGSTAASILETDTIVEGIKDRVEVPTILFPSNVFSISRHADAIWFMSLLNSTNPYFITGAQALGAPLVRRYNIEPLPLGYIVIGEGGTAAFIGHAKPIPYDKPELAAMYSLAAQYLGMHFVYLEAGSGANKPVPPAMIAEVRKTVDLPLIVGGGIRSPEDAVRAAEAGASIVVTGTLLERSIGNGRQSLEPIVHAIRHR